MEVLVVFVQCIKVLYSRILLQHCPLWQSQPAVHTTKGCPQYHRDNQHACFSYKIGI